MNIEHCISIGAWLAFYFLSSMLCENKSNSKILTTRFLFCNFQATKPLEHREPWTYVKCTFQRLSIDVHECVCSLMRKNSIFVFRIEWRDNISDAVSVICFLSNFELLHSVAIAITSTFNCSECTNIGNNWYREGIWKSKAFHNEFELICALQMFGDCGCIFHGNEVKLTSKWVN